MVKFKYTLPFVIIKTGMKTINLTIIIIRLAAMSATNLTNA